MPYFVRRTEHFQSGIRSNVTIHLTFKLLFFGELGLLVSLPL